MIHFHDVWRIPEIKFVERGLLNGWNQTYICHCDSRSNREASRACPLGFHEQGFIGSEAVVEYDLDKGNLVIKLATNFSHTLANARVTWWLYIAGDDVYKVPNQSALLRLTDRRQQRVAIRESLFKVLQNGNGLADTRLPAAGSNQWLQSALGRSRWGLVRFGIRPAAARL
ncbi:hypothetical protein MGU_07608 [Metarhizium guizhouense ARSEF 977]|uniref:Uncharacterized protein n=1 Tax=Metarhizium guizhouense (strain ARSEF 977) TaxID=1276136 RepID=A0A0B4H5Z1_METGA|nr:hypothetical protein MGU_07608 [Metarhizium guizhouense ARSEF 977]